MPSSPPTTNAANHTHIYIYTWRGTRVVVPAEKRCIGSGAGGIKSEWEQGAKQEKCSEAVFGYNSTTHYIRMLCTRNGIIFSNK